MPALHTSIQAVLSLYASGRTTGIVLDSGDGVSHAVPVYEGFAMPSSIRRIDVAGRDVTEYLQTLLRKGGYVFHTSAEKEVVRIIKETVSYVAHDPRKEEREWIGVKPSESRYVEYVLPDGHRLKVRCHWALCRGRRAGWRAGWRTGWLAGWPAGWPTDRLAGWLTRLPDRPRALPRARDSL